ncbi:hypothetical protein [Actinobaculum sp. 352]|uniref:hypothetical protein n=1 Tax=Actinobaculum sp. 352 TaxID=2490946 RepID=UPI000F7F5BF6|nr:hypothetical protein [Actinobaculum sp. 352]RTE49067.1 hypothetical protein EKN07_08040 [Actinobaculum sp. 352]
MALPVRRLGRRSALAGLLLILGAVLLPTSSALADDPDGDPAVYQPDGVGSLFSVPDMRQGQDPTLFEAYPDGAWVTDWKSTGWTHVVDNTVDPVLNGITNVLLGGTKAVTRAAIAFSYQMAHFDMFGMLSSDITEMVRAVATTAIDWLLPTCLAIGAVLVLAKLGVGTGDALRQFGALVLAGVIGMSLAVVPELWTGTMTAIRQAGAETTAKAAEAAVTDLDSPFTGPTPTYGSDETVNAQRRQADAIWRTYVAMPWCIAEFGSLRTCQDYGEEVLSRSGDDRVDFIDGKDFKDAMGGDKSDAWQMTTGQDGATRLAIMLPALLVACLFCGLVIFLNATVLLYSMLALMLLVVGVFFALLWVIPGRPRQWGMTWAEKLFSFVFMSFVANLILMVTMLVAMTTMRLTGDYGWGVSALLTIIASIASLLLVRHLREILGVGSTGLLSMLGTGAAMSMLGRRIRPRRPGRHATRPDTGSEASADSTASSGTTTGGAPRPHRVIDRPQPHRPAGPTRPGRRRRTGTRDTEPVPAVVASPRLTAGPATATPVTSETAAAPRRIPQTPPGTTTDNEPTVPGVDGRPAAGANAPQPGPPAPAPRELPARRQPTAEAGEPATRSAQSAPSANRPEPAAMRPQPAATPPAQPANTSTVAASAPRRELPGMTGGDPQPAERLTLLRRRRSND